MAPSFTESDIEIAEGFFETLKIQKNNSEFSDVIVLAGSSEFNCHRVILAAVSGFFRGLLASGMKETVEGRVTLTDISADVFSQVLTCIYSGRSILTKDNLFSVWAAADLLQIDFILKHCQALFTKTLSFDNCFHYCASVRLLNEKSNRLALNFIIENFQKVRLSEDFYQLSFEEIKYIVSSENLSSSCEDDVIETVLRWAQFTSTLNMLSEIQQTETDMSSLTVEDVQAEEHERPKGEATSSQSGNEPDKSPVFRTELLAELLECCRYLLVSNRFLVHTLSCHPLVKGHTRCRAIVNKTIRYQANSDLHQEWCPSEAIHRNQEAVRNVFVGVGRGGKVHVMFPPSKDLCEMKDASMNFGRSFIPASCIFYHDECLFIFESRPNPNNLWFYTPSSQGWKTICVGKNQQKKILVAQALYTFEENDEDETTSVFKLSLRDLVSQYPKPAQWQSVCQLTVEGLRINDVTCIGNKLIIFWAEPKKDSFTVECYDLYQRQSFVVENQLGSVADLVTFRRDKEAFVLQTTGALWRIHLCPNSDQLLFTQERQLWDGKIHLNGAQLYGKNLYIVGDQGYLPGYELDVNTDLEDVSLDEVFTGIILIKSDEYRFSYTHAVLPGHL